MDFDNGKRYLSADLRIDCSSGRYRAMLAYALVMMAVIPAGFPLAFVMVLRRHRSQLFPANRNRSVRVRHSATAAAPCIVACVEAEFLARDQAEFGSRMQLLGAAMQAGGRRPLGRLGPQVASTGPCAWGPHLGPGDPALQRGGEAMFHFALPSSHTAALAAAVDGVVREWHLAPARYSVAADMEARAADPSVQHLVFLYEVGRGCWECVAAGLGAVSKCVCVQQEATPHSQPSPAGLWPAVTCVQAGRHSLTSD
jgi:hypothetical protein